MSTNDQQKEKKKDSFIFKDPNLTFIDCINQMPLGLYYILIVSSILVAIYLLYLCLASYNRSKKKMPHLKQYKQLIKKTPSTEIDDTTISILLDNIIYNYQLKYHESYLNIFLQKLVGTPTVIIHILGISSFLFLAFALTHPIEAYCLNTVFYK